MVTVIIALQSRKRKDSTQPIVIRVRHLNRYFDKATGYYLSKRSFDRLKSGSIEHEALNTELENLKSDIVNKVRKFLKENVNTVYTLKEIKSFLEEKRSPNVLLDDFWQETIDQLLKTNRAGTARTYINTLSVLSKIIDLNTPLERVGIKDIHLIEKTLRMRGNNYNSIGVYMRTFRAVCNRAINFGIVPLEWYPFRNYKIKREKTVPRVLSLEEMQRYFNADIPPSSTLFKVWNIGKLLFMLRGINLKDLLFLTKDNLKSGRIIYKRSKTKKMYSIGLNEEIIELLKYFKNERLTLLGIILDDYLENEAKSIHHRAQITKRINNKLKKIGEELEFSEKLTTYVFRYSYANIARKLGFSKDQIAEALGHEYGNSVTGIYLELFDQGTLDEMNKIMVKSVTTANII